MHRGGERGGPDHGRGGADAGRGGAANGRGGRNFGAATSRGRPQEGGGNPSNAGQHGVGFNGQSGNGFNADQAGNNAGQSANFYMGESSGTAGFSNNGYGQYCGGGAGYQNRRRFEFRAGRGDYRSRGGFNGAGRGRSGYGTYNRPQGRGYAGSENQQPILNQSLLQEAVGAVVEAVAAVEKQGHQMVLPQQQHVQVPVPRTEQRATQVAGQQNAAAAPARANDVSAEVPAVEVARQQQLAPNVQTSATVMTSNSGANIEVNVPSKKQKKADKLRCFRCGQPGHFVDDCMAPGCDICESPQHITANCPLHLAPKPSINIYGHANEELMFFELPMTESFRPKVENSKMGKVTVVGGILTIPQIIAQLKWLVPSENYQWAVVHFRDNIFKVKFPSKVEVQRMKHFRTYQVPNTGCALSFDEWSIVDEPLYMLPEVWVQVSGIPKDVRDDYLAL
ncbi:hypothetical protein ACQ4PT_001414 [Festuca glaucescens]